MRIDKKLGAIYLSKTDSIKWHRSPAFRRDVVELATEMLFDLQGRSWSQSDGVVHPSVDVFSSEMLGLVSLELRYRTKKKSPRSG